MNEDNRPSGPPSNEGNDFAINIIWLIAAFIPGIAGLLCLYIKHPGAWLFPCLLILNIVSSVASSAALLRKVKNNGERSLFGFLLMLFFFFSNVFIVLFAGCSSMGRISP